MPTDSRSDLARTFLLFAGLGALGGLAFYLQFAWHEISLDLTVYWEAGTRMRHGGAGLYESSTDPNNRVGWYIYPPAFAVLFAPLTWLPRWAGYGVWGLLQVGFVALSFYSVRNLCRVKPGRSTRDFALALAIAVFGAVWVNLWEGQVNLMVVACIATGLWQIESKRPWLGGSLLGLAAQIKVIPIVLIGVLVLQRRWRALGGFALGLVLVWLSPLIWSIPAEGLAGGIARNGTLTVEYVQSVVGPRLKAQKALKVGGTRAPNNALSAVVQRWFGKDQWLSHHDDGYSPLLVELPAWLVRWAGFGMAFVLYLLSLWLAHRLRPAGDEPGAGPGGLGLAAASGLALLAAALGNLLFWSHHLCLLMLLVGPLLALSLRTGALRRRVVLLLVGLVLLTHVPLYQRYAPLDWLAIVGMPTFGVLLAWGVVFWTFFRPPDEVLKLEA